MRENFRFGPSLDLEPPQSSFVASVAVLLCVRSHILRNFIRSSSLTAHTDALNPLFAFANCPDAVFSVTPK